MRILITLIAAALAASLASCQREGPAEKAGRQVDKAGRSIEKAGENVRDAVTGKK